MKRAFIETPVGGSYPPGAPKSDFWPASSGGSDYEGVKTLGGDETVAGHPVVSGGPAIGEAPTELYTYLSELDGKT